MIGSPRGVLVAVALAIVLGALALGDALRGRGGPIDHALIPGFAATRLAWDGGETLVHDGLGWHATSGAALDAGAVDAVVTTLRGAHWQRAAGRAVAGARASAALHVGDHTLAVGQPLAGTEQVWIVRDDAALLVDAWVARAIAVQPWQLHVRRPFADADASDATLAFDGRTIVLAGQRRAGAWIDPVLTAEIAEALRTIEIVGPLPAGAAAAPARATFTIGGKALVERGRCATDQIAVTGVVDGCIAEAPWRTIEVAARLIETAEGADLRPLPIAATGVGFGDGELDLGKPAHVTIGGVRSAVEPGAVRELLAALATRGTRAEVPGGTPRARVVHTAIGDLSLAVYAPDVVVRGDDHVAIRVTPEAYAALVRGARAYRVRALWAEEPTTIARLTVDGASYARGAVIGEWSGTSAAAAVEAYVAVLAHATALDGDPPATFAAVHVVTFDVASPDGRHETRTVELGARTATGCPARVGEDAVLVARSLCAPPVR